MRAQLSVHHHHHHTPTTPHSLPSKPSSRKPRPPLGILNSSSSSSQDTLTLRRSRSSSIGSLQPPWTVPVPPSYVDTSALLFGTNASGSAIPISLRLVQLRKKQRENAAAVVMDASALGSVGSAVWTLACLLERLQRCTLEGDREEVMRDSRYSTVWLFQRVYSSSPEMAVGLITLTAGFVEKALDGLVCGVGGMILDEEVVVDEEKRDDVRVEVRRGNGCWSDIGILDETERRRMGDNACVSYMRKKMVYEHMIVEEKRRNPMILANYAQLLYQYEKDFDRAEDYFFWAVTTEPFDSEAMSKYALFLWHARGDIERAEEMFLEAIQADPENTYHQSNYAWFLHQTGGTDTCYPITDCTTSDNKDDS